MLFKKQEDGKIYECLTILMRVDSQLDDKNMREKMKLMNAFSPRDFGIEREFCCCIIEPPLQIKTIREEVKEEDSPLEATKVNKTLALPGAFVEANEDSADLTSFQLTHANILSINKSGLNSLVETEEFQCNGEESSETEQFFEKVHQRQQ